MNSRPAPGYAAIGNGYTTSLHLVTTPPPVMKGTMTAPTAVDPNRSGSYETAEKDREGTRPRKSVMRKVSARMIQVQCDPIRFGLIQYPIILY